MADDEDIKDIMSTVVSEQVDGITASLKDLSFFKQ